MHDDEMVQMIEQIQSTVDNLPLEQKKEFLEEQIEKIGGQLQDMGLNVAPILKARKILDVMVEIMEKDRPEEMAALLEVDEDVVPYASELMATAMLSYEEFHALSLQTKLQVAMGLALATGASWKEYVHA